MIDCSRLTLNFSHISWDKNDETISRQASAAAYLPQLCSKSPMHCVLGQYGSRAKLIGCSRLTLNFSHISCDKMMRRYQDRHQMEHLPQFSTKSPMQCVLGQDGWRSKRIGCSRLTLNFSHILWDKNDLMLSFLQAVKAPVLTSAEKTVDGKNAQNTGENGKDQTASEQQVNGK